MYELYAIINEDGKRNEYDIGSMGSHNGYYDTYEEVLDEIRKSWGFDSRCEAYLIIDSKSGRYEKLDVTYATKTKDGFTGIIVTSGKRYTVPFNPVFNYEK